MPKCVYLRLKQTFTGLNKPFDPQSNTPILRLLGWRSKEVASQQLHQNAQVTYRSFHLLQQDPGMHGQGHSQMQGL